MPAKSVRECAREFLDLYDLDPPHQGIGEAIDALRIALAGPDRDAEWVAAMAMALGTNSALTVPLAPNEVLFRDLFAEARKRANATIEARLSRVTEAYNAACEYIDSNVCDPDITDEMIRTYAAFKRCRAALADAPDDLVLVRESLLSWAVARWESEVKNRPLINIHRRTLDDTWRQVIRFAGGDTTALLGPSHDQLLAASEPKL